MSENCGQAPGDARPSVGCDGASALEPPLNRSETAQIGVHVVRLRGVEDLREATRGADLRIVQLASGAFHGHLMHARVSTISLSAGGFGPEIRSRGVMNPGLVTIGMMLEGSGGISQWGYDVLPGDVVVFPKSVEQEGHYTGRTRYAAITLGEEELAAHLAGERAFEDSGFWTRMNRFRQPPSMREAARREIDARVSQLRQGAPPLSEAGIDHFRRSLIEAFVAGFIQEKSEAPERRTYRGAKLVHDVEDYVDAIGTDRPVHISELCAALLVSRRTLHRAFQDTLGTGPVAYLRLRRLSAVHRALRAADPPHKSVTQAALDHGFTDLGRFASRYRKLFKEYPSRTRRQAMAADPPAT